MWGIARDKMSGSIYKYVSLSKDLTLLVAMVLTTVVSGLMPSIVSILAGKVFKLLQQLATNEFATKQAILNELTVRSMAILVAGVGSIPFSWLAITTWMFIGERQGVRARRRLLYVYLSKPLPWYDANENLKGDFTQLNRCVEELRSSSAESSALTFQSAITVIALISTSLYYSWSLTLVILCSAPIIAILTYVFSKLVEKYTALENSETANAASVLSWCMAAAQQIRLIGAQDYESTRFAISVQKCSQLFFKLALYASANMASLRLFSLAMFVQGFWYGNSMIRDGKLNIDAVVTCFSACILLSSTLNGILAQIMTMQKGKVAVKRISQLEASDDYQASTRQTNSFDTYYSELKSDDSMAIVPRDIVFKNVSFSYPSRPNDVVLKNVSVTFKPDRINFIVGKSGSGKSTLGNLLLKFYLNYQGVISVNSMDLRSIDESWLLSNITLVEQSCTMFNDTLRNNIMIAAKEGHTDTKSLKTACQMALLEKLILDLPHGLETILGSDGVSLSGGQQQRIALARAIVRDSPVLILDEVTSALDIIHRDLLIEAIRAWRVGKTTIILTHELTHILDDDYLYLMEGGQVVEEGYKGTLLTSKSGKFYNLYSMQQIEDDYDSEDYESTYYDTVYSEYLAPDDYASYLGNSTITYPMAPTNSMLIDGKMLTFGSYFVDAIRANDEKYTPARRGRSRRRRSDDVEKQLESLKTLEAGEGSGLDSRPQLMSICQILQFMFSTLRRKWLLIWGLLFSVLAGATNPIFSYAFSKLLNGLVPHATGSGSPSYLFYWSIILLIITICDAAFTFFKKFILTVSSEYWIMDLRIMAIEKINQNSLNWFSLEINNLSEVTALVLNDLRDLRILVSGLLSALTTLILVAVIGITWALVSGWKLSLVCISLLPLFVILSIIYGGLLQKCEDEYKTSVAQLENCVSEVVQGMKTIRCLQLEGHFMDKYIALESDLKKKAWNRAIATGFGVALSGALVIIVQAILYYYGIKLVIDREYTVERMFQTFTLLLFTIMTCASLMNELPEFNRGQRAATYIHRILQEGETLDTVPTGRTMPFQLNSKSDAVISVNNLDFSYPSAKTVKVYRNLNVSIYPYQKVAVVGESGSGKSTLALLLTGLYSVPRNTIVIDGTDICDWDLDALRRNIALVEQKAIFFDGTIRDNLTYGHSYPVRDSDIYDVLQLVGISDFVNSQPSGLATRIDTNLLSGGQAQRLSIARALLRRPKILILDECTSALDAANSHAIAELIKNSLFGTTILAITHTEQMMRACNDLIVLKDGKVGEKGTFNELFASRGELYRIVTSGEP
ncbi:HFL291Cp [Eremothecium sinecaudum]|uniref:HFL291Cp n=1 Tax=Eremothecium sinecaudum TaxID=45286 RepID=A0A0X8HU71_9SACH|nr:HFL291Cp [Eremothecium sinecaudum]AMD21565.1 HFL291Cp [Eremothecium sinecaudum]